MNCLHTAAVSPHRKNGKRAVTLLTKKNNVFRIGINFRLSITNDI